MFFLNLSSHDIMSLTFRILGFHLRFVLLQVFRCVLTYYSGKNVPSADAMQAMKLIARLNFGF